MRVRSRQAVFQRPPMNQVATVAVAWRRQPEDSSDAAVDPVEAPQLPSSVLCAFCRRPSVYRLHLPSLGQYAYPGGICDEDDVTTNGDPEGAGTVRRSGCARLP